jgi:hypothetical protein
MKKISEAYKELKKILPEDYGKQDKWSFMFLHQHLKL